MAIKSPLDNIVSILDCLLDVLEKTDPDETLKSRFHFNIDLIRIRVN